MAPLPHDKILYRVFNKYILTFATMLYNKLYGILLHFILQLRKLSGFPRKLSPLLTSWVEITNGAHTLTLSKWRSKIQMGVSKEQ